MSLSRPVFWCSRSTRLLVFGRPTIEELRQDLRVVLRKWRPDWESQSRNSSRLGKGERGRFYPYGKTYGQSFGARVIGDRFVRTIGGCDEHGVSMRNTSDHRRRMWSRGRARARVASREGPRRRPSHRQPSRQSPAWCEVLRRASQVAATDTTTCLQGESGWGRRSWRGSSIAPRLAAAARSSRSIARRCPSRCSSRSCLGSSAARSRERTWRSQDQIEWRRRGAVLDEVTEDDACGQAKFLRVLQEREFRRLGGLRPIRANVRVIATTNRNCTRRSREANFDSICTIG